MSRLYLSLVGALALFTSEVCSFSFIENKTYNEVHDSITFYYVYGPTLQDYEVFNFDNDSKILTQSTYDFTKAPLLFFSGFNEIPLENGTSSYIVLSELIGTNENKYNVIVPNYAEFVLDENFLLGPLYYADALYYYKAIGEVTADFLAQLYDNNKTILDSIHIMGFSLGAQIVAIYSRVMQNKYDALPYQITAFDPAGPGYYSLLGLNFTLEHLNETHAKYVYVIHSDAGRLGFACPCGSLDLWPNKGIRLQPGCDTNSPGDIISSCSHLFSANMYACMLRNSTYIGTKCAEFNLEDCGHVLLWQSKWNWTEHCNNGTIIIDKDLNVMTTTGNYYLNATLCDLGN